MSDLDVITAGIPAKDNCPILTRVKAFVSQQGVAATLEYTFRDRAGNPVNLQQDFSDSLISESASQAGSDTVLVRFREFMGLGDSDACTIYRVEGEIVSETQNTVRAVLPVEVAAQSGLYLVSWGFVRDCALKLVNDTLLSVERSLFGNGGQPGLSLGAGPPTLGAIRMALMDSAAAENNLLDDVEFDDDQLIQAIARPIMYFNETNPPIRQKFSTRNFPWLYNWVEGIRSELFTMAAANYRRNRLAVQTGGMMIDDKNKEREYLMAAQLHGQAFRDFTLKKKTALNMANLTGTEGSSYGQMEWY